MKKYILSNVFNPAWMLAAAVLLFHPDVNAQLDNYIVISGQVTNNAYGNPVKNHSVYFLKDSTVTIDSGPLLKEVVTDDEGFYYDTIPTRTSKGSLLVYTKDFFGTVIDTLKYYRFVSYANSNFMISNFDIFMPVQADLLQSRFIYRQKQYGSQNRFKFIDQTGQSGITNWHWDFGDKATSELQNPDHTFPGPGMYKVRLTTTAIIEDVEQTSTMLRVIYIADRSFFHMGGHVYAGYFPANKCLAYLYYVDTTDNTIPVDTVSVDTLGYYGFWEVPSGNYFIKVQPKKISELYGNMMPTYYGDVVFWEAATKVKHEETNWGYHVHFVEAIGIGTGIGNISGNIKYDGILNNIDYELPAQGIDIYVMDASEQTLISHYSNQDGAFEFPEVALGVYWLYPEVTGLNQKKYKVEVTVDEPDVSDIEILLKPGGVDSTDYIEYIIAENALGFPYPNPANDRLSININTNNYSSSAIIDVFDLSGRKLFSQNLQLQSGSNTMSMNVASLRGGVYIVRANVDGIVSQQRFIVSR